MRGECSSCSALGPGGLGALEGERLRRAYKMMDGLSSPLAREDGIAVRFVPLLPGQAHEL